jgi:hypothetical protein
VGNVYVLFEKRYYVFSVGGGGDLGRVFCGLRSLRAAQTSAAGGVLRCVFAGLIARFAAKFFILDNVTKTNGNGKLAEHAKRVQLRSFA